MQLLRESYRTNENSGKTELQLKKIELPEVQDSLHDFGSLEHLSLQQIECQKAWGYGNSTDAVVEMAAFLKDGGAVEVGSYYGDSKPKSIIKISSQIGCPMTCHFCELGPEKFKRNLTPDEMLQQVAAMTQVLRGHHPAYDLKPHKINIAGSGEPLLNPMLVEGLSMLAAYNFSLKVCSVMPASKATIRNFEKLAAFAGNYHGTTQLQISLLSLNEEHRQHTAGKKLLSFAEINELASLWRAQSPPRNQVNLSLILTDDCPVDVEQACTLFPPEHFRFRFRDYVTTEYGDSQGLVAMGSDRVKELKSAFRMKGYVVTDDATPTSTEQEFQLASNVTRRRMLLSYGLPIIDTEK